jgi:hypothetical protein
MAYGVILKHLVEVDIKTSWGVIFYPFFKEGWLTALSAGKRGGRPFLTDVENTDE